MIETLMRNWWLLLLRGLLALTFSVMAFLLQSSAATFTLREFATKGMVVFLGILALIAGACTAAAGIWKSSTGKSWLLLLDGVVISGAGLLLILANGLTFPAVTRTIVVLAAAIGAIELVSAGSLRRHVPDEWFLAAAGAVSFGFAIVFLLMKPEDAGTVFAWLGSYSGFSAVCMLALAFRLRRMRASVYKIAQSVSHSGHLNAL